MLRLVAFALLALIGADVAGDATCDLPTALVANASASLGSPTPEAAEPCVDVCIPDCFCCSRSVAARTSIVPPPAVLVAGRLAAAREDRAAGVRPVADRPPLLLS